jgi:hypothetical protein
MPIVQRRITDRASFVSATDSPRDTAALYFFKQLDPYYESALAVAKDLYARPQLYNNLADTNGERTARVLATLRSRCGNDEYFPSRIQRMEAYSSIFGPMNSSADFDKLRDDMIAAATAFSERVFDTGVDMLRERVRTAHRPLRDYLLGLTGASTDWTARDTLNNIAENISFPILRTPEVAAVFGIVAAPRASWPYLEDSNADKLLEEIKFKIDRSDGLTRQEASNLQRLAARGAEAIAAVIDYTENSANPRDDEASLKVLITTCYTWGAAKKALVAKLT